MPKSTPVCLICDVGGVPCNCMRAMVDDPDGWTANALGGSLSLCIEALAISEKANAALREEVEQLENALTQPQWARLTPVVEVLGDDSLRARLAASQAREADLRDAVENERAIEKWYGGPARALGTTATTDDDEAPGQADDGGDGVNCPACDAGTYGGHLCEPAVITEYRWKYRPGRRSSGAQRGGGKVLHLVEHQRDHGPGLCGARPGRTSAWAEDPTAPPGSMRLCEKCQRRYAEPSGGAGGAS